MMDNLSMVSDYMVQNPVCADLWQPVSFVRQIMLTNSFSYLPLLRKKNQTSIWYLISDHSIAKYLRSGNRNERLATPLVQAITSGSIKPEKAATCQADTPINEALKALELTSGHPILVCAKNDETRLLGIVTPFDLL